MMYVSVAYAGFQFGSIAGCHVGPSTADQRRRWLLTQEIHAAYDAPALLPHD